MNCNTTFGFVWSPIISCARLGQWTRTLMAAIALAAGSASAQTGGTVNFGNHSSSLVINGQTSLPVTAADNVRAALYWGALGSSTFTQLGASVAVGTPLPGLFVGGTRTSGPATAGGSNGLFQVRAWGGGYGTYEEALLQVGVLIGQSAVITSQTGDPLGSPPSAPVSLLAGGFQGFTLTPNSGPSQPPTLVCAGNKTVECGSDWTFDTPAAADGCTSNSLPAYEVSTVTAGLCPQLITRTWAATNSCDTNYALCSQVVTVTCSNCPMIVVTKQCPPHPVPPGGTLIFTGAVTNAGNVTLTDVLVVNDQPAPNTLVYGPATLAPGAGAEFSASYRVPPCSCGPFVDTLTGSGTSIYGGVVTSFATTTCPGTNAYALAGDLNGDGIVDQDELNAVLANYWASSQWLYMSNPVSLSGGFFQFALTNATGWNFTVLASSDGLDWTNLPGPAYPVYQFNDPAAAGKAPVRLYRLRWP